MDFINDCVAAYSENKKKWVDSGISLNRRPDFMQRNLKPLIARIRPFDVNSAIQLIVAKPHDYSFPSGHTAASFTAVMALYLAGEKKLWKIALVLAVLIAFSRLYLYVHYPTDVLGGIITGAIAGYIGYKLTFIVQSKHRKKL